MKNGAYINPCGGAKVLLQMICSHLGFVDHDEKVVKTPSRNKSGLAFAVNDTMEWMI